MTYQELEQLKKSKEYEAMQTLMESVNSFSFNPKRFAQAIATEHRTLQQSFFRIMLETIKVMGADDYGFDPRNQCAHEACKRIVEFLPSHVPFV